MKTTAFALVGTVLIIIHTENPPSDEEWSGYLATLKTANDRSRLRCIAFTDGGAPNSRQRKALNDILKGNPLPAVAISGNSIIRGVVTALNWFNPLVKAFPPERLTEAYQYLKMTRDEMDAVNRKIPLLQKELNIKLRCLEGIR